MKDRLFGKERGFEDPKSVTAQFITDYSHLLDALKKVQINDSNAYSAIDNIQYLLESVSQPRDVRKVDIVFRDTSFKDRTRIIEGEDPGVHVSILASNGYRFYINAYGGFRIVGASTDHQDFSNQYRRGQIHSYRTEEIASHEINLNVDALTPKGLGSYRAMDSWLRIGPRHTNWIQMDSATFWDRHKNTSHAGSLVIASPDTIGTQLDIRDQVAAFIRIRDAS